MAKIYLTIIALLLGLFSYSQDCDKYSDEVNINLSNILLTYNQIGDASSYRKAKKAAKEVNKILENLTHLYSYEISKNCLTNEQRQENIVYLNEIRTLVKLRLEYYKKYERIN